MKKINLAITGCMGRMGQQLIKSSKSNSNFKLVSLTENIKINKKFNGIKPEPNTEVAFKKADIIIDFTIPKCTIEVLKIASKLKKRVVIGTTGFTQKEDKIITVCAAGVRAESAKKIFKEKGFEVENGGRWSSLKGIG